MKPEQVFIYESSPYNSAIVITDSVDATADTVWNHRYLVIHHQVGRKPKFVDISPQKLKPFVESRKNLGWYQLSPFARDEVQDLIVSQEKFSNSIKSAIDNH